MPQAKILTKKKMSLDSEVLLLVTNWSPTQVWLKYRDTGAGGWGGGGDQEAQY